MHLTRRQWLQAVVAQGAASALAASTGDRISFDGSPFRLGIASGDPTSRSVVLWTRLVSANPMRVPWEGRTVHVEWQLSKDPGFEKLERRGDALAPPELSHSVHAEVDGLEPDQVYWYRFISGNQTSPVGRTRTLPAADSASAALKLAFASCQRYHAGEFVVYDQMAADAPDLVVFLGDYIYESGASEREVRGSWMYAASRIQDYRLRYELAKSDPALQKMHAACPWIILWDDHEVANDYAGGEVRLKGKTGRVARQMEMGYRAWYEHMPISPRALTGGIEGLLGNTRELRLYASLRWGRLANLIRLDTRQYRSAQAACGVGGLFSPGDCADLHVPERSMLGEAQAHWLDDQLKANGQGQPEAARWNLICQPTVFSRFVVPALGGRLNHDNWDGYPASRQRILQQIAGARTRNPIIFSGDVHQNWVAHVHQDPDDPATPVVAPEFCVTSVTTPSFGSFTADEMKALAPHCVYADRHRRGYMLALLTPQSMTVVLKQVDIRTGLGDTVASFEVQAGSPRITLRGKA